MTDELRLRPETGEDADFLKALYRSTREDLLQLGLPSAMLDTLLEMQFRAQRSGYRSQFPDHTGAIVEKNGQPIGSLLKNIGVAEIRLVYIALLPEERGKGYGRHLVMELQQEAALAARPLALSVDPLNEPAKGLYLSLGFQVDGNDGANLEMIWRADGLTASPA